MKWYWVAAIAILAIVIYAAYKAFGTLANLFEAPAKTITDAVDAAVNTVGAGVNAVLAAPSDIFGAVASAGNTAGQTLKADATAVDQSLTGSLTAASSELGNLGNTITSSFASVPVSISHLFGGFGIFQELPPSAPDVAPKA